MAGNRNDWGADEIFRDTPEFFGNPNIQAHNYVTPHGKKHLFLASLSIAASVASDASGVRRDAYDIYNDLYTELSMRSARMVSNTSKAAEESKRLAKHLEELAGAGSIRSMSGIAVTSYLEDLKLAHRVSATAEALEEGATIVLPFPHELAPGIQMRKRVPVWGVLTSYPNVPGGESSTLDETTTASVVFPIGDKPVRMSILPEDLVTVIAAENRTVSDGNTGFIVAAR